jgi:ribosomal protein S2
MKIFKLDVCLNKLLKLELTKVGIYSTSKCLNYINLENVEHRLKKGLSIIYKLSIVNKFLFFVGSSINIKEWVNIRNIITVKSVWIRGILTNSILSFKKISKNQKVLVFNKILKLLFSLKKRIDLLIAFNEFLSKNLIEESYKVKIPVVSLNSDLITSNKSCFKVPNYLQFYKKYTRDAFFCFLLVTLLKKVIQIKQLKI